MSTNTIFLFAADQRLAQEAARKSMPLSMEEIKELSWPMYEYPGYSEWARTKGASEWRREMEEIVTA